MRLKEQIDQLLEISRTFPGTSLETALALLQEKSEQGHMYVAVVGIFKQKNYPPLNLTI